MNITAAASMGARLEAYLKEKNISQADLERMSGVRQQTISYLIRTGAKSSSYAIRIASALGVNPVWLQEGSGDPRDPSVSVGNGSGISVVRSHFVPLLGMNNEVASFLQNGHAPETAKRVSVTFDVGDKAFAMEVAGRSNEPELRAGDEVIVDPSVAPEPGELVVAQSDDIVILRKYRALSSSAYELVPINPDFPTINSNSANCRILGTVMESRRRTRRG